ncbi:ABC transporter ATP-binding protein [Euzebya tangerina]|uniref:ABC transporter ATP-binding protein n=1 Tax=Euzebya tangerina TaxID=591198 RepID=UPI000E32100C|nr:ABC transporter ATP-binding protein [Euzebya tangerina]
MTAVEHGDAIAHRPTTSRAVVVEGLTKVYAGRTVVDGVSFSVEQGEIFAILGPNGAGKTTTVESIAGLRTPDTGVVRVFGHDPLADRATVRQLLGVQLQESSFQDKLTVREIVDTYRGLYPDPLSTDELLERLGLGPSAGTRYAKLSGGQQQRVSIAVALVGRPRAVILDELTTGLDPQSRRDTWTLVEELRDTGVTVVLVTHVMEEAERLADRLALIDRGRVVALDTPEGLVAGAGLEQQLRFSTTASLDEDWIRRLPEVSGVARDHDEFIVTGDERMLFSVVSLLAAHDIVPGRLQVDQPTLDDAFVALAGRTLHAADDNTPEVAR